MKRTIVVAAGVIAAALIAIPTLAEGRRAAARQRASSDGWVICREQLTLHLTPPLTVNPQPGKVSGSDVLGDCSSSDPTITHGIAILRSKGPHFACMAGGGFQGVGRIRWNNGRVTVIHEHGSFGAGIVRGEGKIASGSEFAGASFKVIDKAVIDSTVPELCASPMGLNLLAADGEIVIGHTSIDGIAFTP